jgi:hypothetical protein
MSKLEELLKKAEEEHRKFEIEQYKEILERLIPPMLEEFKYNAKLCMSRLPPERVKAKFYRSLTSIIRHLKVQINADMEYAMNKPEIEEKEKATNNIRD